MNRSTPPIMGGTSPTGTAGNTTSSRRRRTPPRLLPPRLMGRRRRRRPDRGRERRGLDHWSERLHSPERQCRGGQGSSCSIPKKRRRLHGGVRTWWEWKPSSEQWTNRTEPAWSEGTRSPLRPTARRSVKHAVDGCRTAMSGRSARADGSSATASGPAAASDPVLWASGVIYTLGTDGNWWGWQTATGQWFRVAERSRANVRSAHHPQAEWPITCTRRSR